MSRFVSRIFKQFLSAQCWCDDCNRVMVPSSRRRRRKDGIPHQFQRVDLLVVVLFLTAASGDALLFKRGRGGHSGWSKGKNLGRDKVKGDVAWILEDTSEGGWKPVSDDGHVKVWKRSMPGSEFMAIKSSATLLVSPQALFEVLTPGDIDIVRKYNPMVEHGTDLEVVDRDNKVSWSATMPIWPCRPRDFVTHIRRAKLDDGSVAIVNSATTHPKAPESGRYVRGEILHGVFHIKPTNDKKHSEFTMVHHFNPGGNVPAWLMNWLAEGKPISFVRRLEDVAKEWDMRAAEYRSMHRTMPCKGRGFADKPCSFLMSAKDVDQAPGSSRWWGSGSAWIARKLVLLMALATAAAMWYGRAAVGRGWLWLQIFSDKDESSSTRRSNMPGGECEAIAKAEEDTNGSETNGGMGGGEIASRNVLPPDQEAPGIRASADETSVDGMATLGACGVANGRLGNGGVGDEEVSVVAGRGDGSGDGKVLDVYESRVEPVGLPAPKEEVSDRAMSFAVEPERVLAIAGIAATATAEINGHR